jgi:hypothetical protein
MNCNVCESENLIEGTIMSGSASAGVYAFVPNDKSIFKRIFGIGGREIHSYACVHCGNLQFVVDFSEDDKKQHLEFEGQPPSVTERLDEKDVLDEKLETSNE